MKKVLYITATLPALTVTFIYNEIFRLRAGGTEVDTVSMNTPPDREISAAAADLRQTTLYLDALPFAPKLTGFLWTAAASPVRTLRCLRHLFTASPVKLPRDFRRLCYHLIEAGYLARRMRVDPPEHIHCHFINGPTSIGMFLAMLLDVPYSFTMHASMIWLDPIAFRNKLRTAEFVVSISEYNRQYVLGTYGQEYADKIHVVHCGINPGGELPAREAGDHDGEFRVLGVGQLNRRKGFHILIPALAQLRDRGITFHCTIVGEGAERAALAQQIADHELGDRVTLAGAVLHEDVKRLLSVSDAFVLPCVVSEDGWRDGIPVALMEAMYAGLPTISTDILGLPELINDGEDGLLVPSGQPAPLADALERVARDPELRDRLGRSGRSKVLAEFNNDISARRLQSLIEAC